MSASSTSSSERNAPEQRASGRSRRFWRSACCVLLALGAIEGFLAWAETTHRIRTPKEWTGAHSVRRGLEAIRQTEGVDLILTGNSVANRFQPETLAESLAGIRRYPAVAGIAGASSGVLAEIAADSFLTPPTVKTLVLIADTQGLNEQGLRREEEAAVLAECQDQLQNPVSAEISFFLRRHVRLYRYQYTLRDWLLSPQSFAIARRPPKRPRPAGSWDLKDTKYVYKAEENLKVGARAEADLFHLQRACREREIQLVLVIPPLPEGYDGYWDTGWDRFEQYRTDLAALATELGCPLIDLHGPKPWAPSLFSDSHHLAPEGAAIASRRLGLALREVLR